jgi:hypothetical protein
VISYELGWQGAIFGLFVIITFAILVVWYVADLIWQEIVYIRLPRSPLPPWPKKAKPPEK